MVNFRIEVAILNFSIFSMSSAGRAGHGRHQCFRRYLGLWCEEGQAPEYCFALQPLMAGVNEEKMNSNLTKKYWVANILDLHLSCNVVHPNWARRAIVSESVLHSACKGEKSLLQRVDFWGPRFRPRSWIARPCMTLGTRRSRATTWTSTPSSATTRARSSRRNPRHLDSIEGRKNSVYDVGCTYEYM